MTNHRLRVAQHFHISSVPSLPGNKPLLLIIVLDLNAQSCEVQQARLKGSWSLRLIQEPGWKRTDESLAVKTR